MKLVGSDYARFVRRNRAPLGFGFILAFLSSPGQTFFIALFASAIVSSLEISVGTLGTLYLIATLCAAALLPSIGHLIDRIDLRLFTGLAIAALGVGCVAMAAVEGPIGFTIALILVRLSGQGLMLHIQATATARYFDLDRGRALSLTALGLPFAAAVMPTLTATLIGLLGWRHSFAVVGASILVVFLPIALVLLSGRKRFTSPPAQHFAGRPRFVQGLLMLIRSGLFWLALPILFYMPCIGTAVLFYIEPIAAARGASLDRVASAFLVFALAHAASLLLSGPLVDRFSARRLLGYSALPMILGIALMAGFDHWSALFLLLGLLGVTTGMSQTVVSALWAEAFGVHRLGTIRSVVVAIMVSATAAGPAIFGLFLDRGVAPTAILIASAIAGAAAFAIAMLDRSERAKQLLSKWLKQS